MSSNENENTMKLTKEQEAEEVAKDSELQRLREKLNELEVDNSILTERLQSTTVSRDPKQTGNYKWYRISMKERIKGITKIDINPASWEIGVTVKDWRKYFEPRGKNDHNEEAPKRQRRDDHWLRLTDSEYNELEKWLKDKTISDVSIAPTPFDDADSDDVVLPNPDLWQLIEIRQEQPSRWQDCWYDEHYIHLADPIKEEDAKWLILRSPFSEKDEERVNGMLELLMDGSKSHKEAVKHLRLQGV